MNTLVLATSVVATGPESVFLDAVVSALMSPLAATVGLAVLLAVWVTVLLVATRRPRREMVARQRAEAESGR